MEKRYKEIQREVCGYAEVQREISRWLGPKIRRRMMDLGLSQPMLEKMTGVGASTISDYVMGKYEPSLSKIVVLSEALRVDWRFFFEEAHMPREEFGERQSIHRAILSPT
jgi:transcriptional regulator with XRE-family HTH domain